MEPLIKVKNLNKSFYLPGRTLHVLKDITLDLYKGEMVAIMGPSGVGKSTLLYMLGALDRPTSGNVFYQGTDIFSLNDDALADFRNRTIGFVFQFHHLLSEFTAIENVMMPLLLAGVSKKEAYERAERLLQEVGLYERLTHKPGQLSGGEQQRVAVARALILNPRVVLADEPTGNLDTQTGDELFRLLIDINREKEVTFVVVTHNEALALRCRRVIKMLDGRIINT
jgi:lipoprotein-releasing system ATP-binding protein